MHQLTHPDRKFAEQVAANINKDYPGQAIVKDDCCFITVKHLIYCESYVIDHCKIKAVLRTKKS